MRKKIILYILPLCIFIGAAVFGIMKRQTYVDFTSEEGFLTRVKVPEFPLSLIDGACESMRSELPKSPVILRVEAAGDIEFLSGQLGIQKAVVRQVYAGDGIEEGSEIYVDSGSINFDALEYGRLTTPVSSGHELDTGFVNLMSAGDEYLIFVKEILGESETGIPVVALNDGYDSGLIYPSPKFSYKEHRNAVIPVPPGEMTYVDYKDVMDNEFFMTAEEAMEKILELKKEFIMMYPASK